MRSVASVQGKWSYRWPLALVLSLGANGLHAETGARPKCEAGKGYVAVDLASRVTSDFLEGMTKIGVGTIIRYYDWEQETIPGKTINENELKLIKQNDLAVAVVFQHKNSAMATFQDKDRGNIDAARSLALAARLKQSPGSAIYFGVDGPEAKYLAARKKAGLPSTDEYADLFIKKYVGRYFSQINSKFKGSGYKVGAYGGGRTCRYLLDSGLASYCWLAPSTTWPGYAEFKKSNDWVLKQHLTTDDCFELSVDLNTGNERFPDFGQWRPN
jgi:hypothetical protein